MLEVIFFNNRATTEICTFPLPAALPFSPKDARAGRPPVGGRSRQVKPAPPRGGPAGRPQGGHHRRRHPQHLLARLGARGVRRSEEHTSELQSRQYLVCRLLLEKKEV